MVDAALLPDTAANGINNSTALTAFKGLIGQARRDDPRWQMLPRVTFSQQRQRHLRASKTRFLQARQRLREAIQQPIVSATAVPTATLNQAIVQAFNQNTGFTPSQAQIDQFVSSVTGQEKAAAEAPQSRS